MKIVEVAVNPAQIETVLNIGKQHGAIDQWAVASGDQEDRAVARLLVDDKKRQEVLDALQNLLSHDSKTRIVLLPVEATLPIPERDSNEAEEKQGKLGATREELYHNVSKSASLDANFVTLVVLSTIVATIGLIENNVAVIIGAMVIAPLLGPNIALALATALGDRSLVWQAFQTNIAGLGIALALSMGIGWVWPFDATAPEIVSRTVVGLDSVALALASGAAAVLSLTTGLSSVLVGVMVAVALLPPTATLGLMLGTGQWSLALGAGLLLAVNIVCVNLSAKIVLLIRGVKPRTWLEKQKARQSMVLYIMFWVISLLILVAAIILRAKL